MDYAAAVNEEIRDLFAAGADVVQIDEPYMQARPEKARQYGLKALNRALEGVQRHDRGAHLLRLRRHHPRAARAATPSCPSWRGCSCQQVSIETAQSNLDCAVLQALDGKQIMVGCIDLADPQVETPADVVARIERALPYVKAENVILAPDCGMKYLPRETRHRQAARDGRGGADPAPALPIRCPVAVRQWNRRPIHLRGGNSTPKIQSS